MPFLQKIEKWPRKFQWKYFFRVFSKKEKILFGVLFLIFFGSVFSLARNFYLNNTNITASEGGQYIEGQIGQPRFINPIYANSDTDRDISQLVFSGLMRYNEKMEPVPDLAQNYEITDGGRTYKFYLKENLVWDDNSPITADDVLFTIKTIQNPDYKSPYRANWVGVEVKKLNDLSVVFRIKKPYAFFLENCAFKILPGHIWEKIGPERIAFDIHNLEPVGSGPYKIKELRRDKNEAINYIILKKNPNYHGKKPYISEVKFVFFDNEKNLLGAASQGKIKAFSLDKKINIDKRWVSHEIYLPRYFALFLNLEKTSALSAKEVRTALEYATDKKSVISKALGVDKNEITEKFVSNSPVLPDIYGIKQPSIVYSFDTEKAKKILDDAGYKDADNDDVREKTTNKKPAFQLKTDLRLNSSGTEVEQLQKCLSKFPDIYEGVETTGKFGKKTEEAVIKFQEKYFDEIIKPSGKTSATGEVGKSTRKKLNELCFSGGAESEPLKFSLITVDQSQMSLVADEIKKQWKNIGVEVEVKKFSISEIEEDYIKPREYEILLFGEVLGASPDLFPFWHSSQKKDPGLNLSGYENKNADKIMEEIRAISDSNERSEKLAQLQDIIINDSPAIFLYSSKYNYFVSGDLKGFVMEKISDPSKRFTGIENLFIATKRIWK